MRNAALAVAAIVAFFVWLPQPDAPQPAHWPEQPGASFMLRGVRVFDGERVRERVDVLVRDGVIEAVASKLRLPAGVPEYAADGHTLLPALIDAHTHNFMGSRADALRFGVATQVDLFSDHRALAAARARRESLERTDEADMWSAGTLVTAAGGHGTQFGMPIPTLDDPAAAAEFVAARVAEGSDFIKLVFEPGTAWGREIQTLDEQTLTAAITAAHALGKLAVVHASTRADAAIAVAAGADGLVHVFGDEPVDDALLAALRERDVFVVPTLAVLESVSGRTSGLGDDARFAPHLSPEQVGSLARAYPAAPERQRVIDVASANVRALHAAGVAVLAGSDAPNPGTAHGASVHRELALLVAAGLTPADALAAATAVTADRFRIADRGRVARGQRADLLLVAGDPTVDIAATRDIVAVWKNGYRVARARFDAFAGGEALTDGTLGTFDGGTDGWMPTTDRIMGGGSDVSVRAAGGVLAAVGEVRAGAPWPWAGAMRMLGPRPMAAVDASGFTTLELRVRASGPVSVLFFSGRSEQGPPQVWPVEDAPDWQSIAVPLAEVPGFDAAHARAVAVVAGPATGRVSIELDDVVLR